MNLSAVGAWAELVSAIAVVMSLLYLSTQIRQSTKVAKAAAQESLADAFRDVTRTLAADPELYRIFDVGVEEFDSLRGSDRGRFFHLAFQFAKTMESAHYHYTNGLLDASTWEGWRNAIAHYFNAPGWRKYWALRSDLYSPRFRDFVAKLPAPSHRATAGTIPEFSTLEQELSTPAT